MSRRSQGIGLMGGRLALPAVPRLVVAAALGLLTGCAGGLDLDRLGADRTLTTQSIAKPGKAPDPRVSDEAAIRATVSGWMPASPPPEVVPWVNSNTGSAGAIKAIGRLTDRGAQCSTFTASREGFDGVGRYNGKACNRGGVWLVETLEPG